MTNNIEIESGAGKFQAYLSTPDKKTPGIILIHEVWGLNNHTKDVANRLAGQGYAVLAPDLLSQTGITTKIDQSILAEIQNPATRDEAQKKMRAAYAPLQVPEFAGETTQKLQACYEFLAGQDYCTGKVAVMGFCFGGTYSYALAMAEPKLSCAVVFYGHSPEPVENIQAINCPVLVFNGEKDQGIMPNLPKLKKAVEKYKKTFEFYEYPNVGHAFFNDTNPTTYNKQAAQDAWPKTLEFLQKNLN